MRVADKPIVVAGDWHGDTQWMRKVVDRAAASGADLILHVGDLAVLWPGRDKGKFERRIQQRLELRDLQLVFIDGNHDNHHDLRALPLDEDGLAPVRPRVRYLPRGARFTHSGLVIAGLGGAHSIDQKWRTTGKDWWPDEDVTDEDVLRLMAGGPADVLLTHDVPYGVDVKSEFDLPPQDLEAAARTRLRLRRAVDGLRPAHVFSGHWHQRVIQNMLHLDGSTTRVDVLNMQGSGGGNAVLMWPGAPPLRIEPLMVGDGIARE